MRSPFYFISKPKGNERYNNVINICGIEFISNVSEEDHKFSNRIAIVESTPSWYSGPIRKGTELLVHHNTFKFYNDMKSRRRSGRAFFRDDVFLIDEDQFFMYRNPGEDWVPIGRYCFVSPVDALSGLLVSLSEYESLVGNVEYPNEFLLSRGVTKGTKVCFAPDSEYEFDVDGRKMWRMFDHQIAAIYE